jgi:hypothetical protein
MADYGKAMIDDSARPQAVDAVFAALRERLVHGDALAGAIAPMLRHLLANEDISVFSEEVVARVRGMIGDVARQLLDRHGDERMIEPEEPAPEQLDRLVDALIASPALLRHAHALALEWQLTERLQARLALDPVLPQLVQAMIASPDPATAELAMQCLAAQSRFCQAQRRMRLPLAELPGDLLHAALQACGTVDGETEAAIRAGYDERLSRLGLMSRLVSGMGPGVVAALSIAHAGAAIFLSALAMAVGQDRDAAALSTNAAQSARLAVALRAAGMKPAAIEEQLLAIHPESTPTPGFEQLSPDQAAALLAATVS